MSLSALIDKLSTLVSKAYVFSAFIPVLVFGFINGTLLWFHSRSFHRWAEAHVDKPSAFAVGSIVVGLAVAAYMLLSVNTFLREALEGKYLFEPVRSHLVARQRDKLNAIWNSYVAARDDRLGVSESIPNWRKELGDAAAAGIKGHPKENRYNQDSVVARSIAVLRKKRDAAETITFADLDDAARTLRAELAQNDESEKGPDDDRAAARSRLRTDRIFLIDLFDYAERTLLADEMRFLNRRQFEFGDVAAPTVMGNIAASVYAWAMTRYSMNLATFWSRLQPGLQADSNFYTVLQDAKFQLDFLIACCWMSALTWLAWTIALIFLKTSLSAWLLVTIAGPFLTYFFYRLAATSYASFGDIMRTSVDLYRFSVLRAMHIPIPAGIAQERRTWEVLQKLTVFGQENVELSYAKDESKPKTPAS